MSTCSAMVRRVGCAAILAGGFFCLPVLARAEPLALTPGLWEMTSAAPPGGMQLPPEMLAKLTPEQAAMVQAQIAARSQPQTRPHCITKAMLARGIEFKNPKLQDCHRDSYSVSAHRFALSATCMMQGREGPRPASMQVQIDADAPTHYAGTVDVAAQTQPGAGAGMKMHLKIEGVFKSADCGAVKPDLPDQP